MSNHSPAPWRSDDDNPLLILDGNGTSVAMLIRGYTSTECELNRRIIAAAPETAAERDKLKEVNAELLAALRAMLSVCGCGTALDCSVCNSARAAIAKAEGKS